jgi:hypothetical protein
MVEIARMVRKGDNNPSLIGGLDGDLSCSIKELLDLIELKRFFVIFTRVDYGRGDGDTMIHNFEDAITERPSADPEIRAMLDREFPSIEPEDNRKRDTDRGQTDTRVARLEYSPVVTSPSESVAAASLAATARNPVSKSPSPRQGATARSVQGATARSRKRARPASPAPARRSRRRVVDRLQPGDA